MKFNFKKKKINNNDEDNIPKVTKVILNDLQGKKRIVHHDFANNIIVNNDDQQKDKKTKKPKKYKPLSTQIIAIICATSVCLLMIFAYSYNKIQDRNEINRMINQANDIVEKSFNESKNFYKNEIGTLNKQITKNNQKQRTYKPKKQTS